VPCGAYNYFARTFPIKRYMRIEAGIEWLPSSSLLRFRKILTRVVGGR